MFELTRGKQFDLLEWKHSGMYADGPRLATGGSRGDAYGFYVNFEVESIAGINLAFDYTWV